MSRIHIIETREMQSIPKDAKLVIVADTVKQRKAHQSARPGALVLRFTDQESCSSHFDYLSAAFFVDFVDSVCDDLYIASIDGVDNRTLALEQSARVQLGKRKRWVSHNQFVYNMIMDELSVRSGTP